MVHELGELPERKGGHRGERSEQKLCDWNHVVSVKLGGRKIELHDAQPVVGSLS